MSTVANILFTMKNLIVLKKPIEFWNQEEVNHIMVICPSLKLKIDYEKIVPVHLF
jgi:hypothetical protein